jgi:integrase
VLSRWAGRKVKDITRRDIVRLLNEIVDRGAPIQANRTLTILRRMFNFAIGQAIIDSSPCDRVEAPSAENRRDRVLSEDEIRLLWQTLDSAPMEPNARRLLRLMLVTGQRRGEVLGIVADEIDRGKQLWTLPAERSKNSREHLIPLSHMALEILAELRPNERGYLFPSSVTGRPYKGQSIDHATGHLFEPRRNSKDRKASRTGAPPPLAGQMERFTPHDLRRTVATRMRELGISRGDVKMVLNHVETDVTARYDRYDGLAEKRRALDLWAKRVEQIITDERSTENVFELVRA